MVFSVAFKGSNPFFLLELVENFLAIKKKSYSVTFVLEIEVPGFLFVIFVFGKDGICPVCVFCHVTFEFCRKGVTGGVTAWEGGSIDKAGPCAPSLTALGTSLSSEERLCFLCVLFADQAQVDGSHCCWLREPVMISRYRTSWILTQVDKKFLNFISCPFLFLLFFLLIEVGKNFEVTLKFCAFVRMTGSIRQRRLCRWETLTGPGRVSCTSVMEEFSLWAPPVWARSCAWLIPMWGGPGLGGRLGRLTVRSSQQKYWGITWLLAVSFWGCD